MSFKQNRPCWLTRWKWVPLFKVFSGDLLDAGETMCEHTACPSPITIQEGGHFLLEERVKTVLQSVEQRRDGRAMAASTFYLVSNLKINPIPVQGSEKTSREELKGTPGCQIPPLYPHVPGLTFQIPIIWKEPQELIQTNPSKEFLLLPILLGLLAFHGGIWE